MNISGLVKLGRGMMMFGIIVFVVGMVNCITGAEAADWTETQGTVTRTWVDMHTNTHDQGNAEHYTNSYAPKVEFEFLVGKFHTFQGNRLKFMSRYFSTEGEAKAVLSQYPVGKAVTVYFDPEEPRQSVLQRPSSSGFSSATPSRGLYLFLAGLLLSLSSWPATLWRRLHNRNSPPPHTSTAGPAKVQSVEGRCPKCPNHPELQGPANDRRCERCQGNLLSDERVTEVLTQLGLEQASVEDLMREMGVPVLPCPGCGQRMHQAPIRGSIIDQCLSCHSMWVDAGELSDAT